MLRDQVGQDMRGAMKAREQVRVSTLRMLMSAIKNVEVERGHALSDEEVVEVVQREAKRRRESIDAFDSAGRAELAEKERGELAVLEGYLPAQLPEEELALLVDEAITQTQAAGPKDMGKVMKAVMPKVKGRADGTQVSAVVRQRLQMSV